MNISILWLEKKDPEFLLLLLLVLDSVSQSQSSCFSLLCTGIIPSLTLRLLIKFLKKGRCLGAY